MTRPSPVPSGHPLPQGERAGKDVLSQGERAQEAQEEVVSKFRPLTEVAKEHQARRKLDLPSPLAGEGVSRRLTGEGFAKLQAKRMRQDMTVAETRLWHVLRGNRLEGFKFRRQFAIGNYVADFVCLSQRLIVEVDGSQHEASAHDAERDAWLRSQGFQVLRLWNNDILKNMDSAVLAILAALRLPSPASHARGTLSREGRGQQVDEKT